MTGLDVLLTNYTATLTNGEDVRHLFLDQRLGHFAPWSHGDFSTSPPPPGPGRLSDLRTQNLAKTAQVDLVQWPRKRSWGMISWWGWGSAFWHVQHSMVWACLGTVGRSTTTWRPRWLRSFDLAPFDLAPGGKVCGYDTGRSSGDHSCSVFSSSWTRDTRPKAARARAVALLGPKSY